MRKYTPEAPPAHIEVTVVKDLNGKPVPNAEVVFHPLKNGKDKGNMEIKTNREGIATLDLIPVGQTIRLQVIADGYQTYGQDIAIDTNTKLLTVKMHKPVAQSSVYARPGVANAAAAASAASSASGSAGSADPAGPAVPAGPTPAGATPTPPQ